MQNICISSCDGRSWSLRMIFLVFNKYSKLHCTKYSITGCSISVFYYEVVSDFPVSQLYSFLGFELLQTSPNWKFADPGYPR